MGGLDERAPDSGSVVSPLPTQAQAHRWPPSCQSQGKEPPTEEPSGGLASTSPLDQIDGTCGTLGTAVSPINLPGDQGFPEQGHMSWAQLQWEGRGST